MGIPKVNITKTQTIQEKEFFYEPFNRCIL